MTNALRYVTILSLVSHCTGVQNRFDYFHSIDGVSSISLLSWKFWCISLKFSCIAFLKLTLPFEYIFWIMSLTASSSYFLNRR